MKRRDVLTALGGITAAPGLASAQILNLAPAPIVPGPGDVPVADSLFRQGKKGLQKREIVVLLKPTVIHGDKQWEQDLVETRDRIRAMERPLPQPAR